MQISLHEAQSEVFTDLFVDRAMRNAVVVDSRGWGKSWLAGTCAVNAVFELLQLRPTVPNKNVYFLADGGSWWGSSIEVCRTQDDLHFPEYTSGPIISCVAA
jgi:hypothetical protein